MTDAPTEALFLEDAYAKTCAATVLGVTDDGGVILDRTVFYATGGGQPGDAGKLVWEGGEAVVATTVKGAAPGQVTLLRAGGPIYDYAVGMEPNRNALIMRNVLLKRAKDHLESMSKAEKGAIKALENYAANPTVDGSVEQKDPEAE